MSFFLTWILPPLLGALIGYVTNWLAIKMLFRPYREYRLGRFRVPFTPGLLPKERKRLSASVGETVAKELLTVDVVQKRLGEPDIRAALEKAIAERLDAAFASEAGGLVAEAASSGSGPLRDLLGRAWSGLVASEPFAEAVAAAMRSAFVAAERLPLSSVLPPESARELAERLLRPESLEEFRGKLRLGLESVYAGERPEGALASLLEEPALGGLLPAEALEPLVELVVESLYRASLPAVDLFLRRPETKKGLERYALAILRRAVARLNPVQRLFVGLGQYERTIEETMPETVDDLVAAASDLLREPAMARRAAEAAAAAFESASGETPAALLRRIVGREAALAAVDAALGALREHGPAVAERVAALVAARPDASLASLLAALGLPAEELASRASRAAVSLLSGEGKGGRLLSGILPAFAKALSEGLDGRSVGSLVGADEALRARLAAFLADKALVLVSEEAGKIVEGLDVARIVVEKLDSLDMIEVERIIFGVVDKELRWITLLGGVLGGLIGVLQSLLSLLRGI